MLWNFVSFFLWSRTPRSWHGFRCAILRAFGATVGRNVRISPDVAVEVPWHLSLGDGVEVEERAILYCLGQVSIGRGTLVGPFVHVCAGTHDYRDPRFTLLRTPIVIGERCVLLTACLIGPGVTVADGTVALERASVLSNTRPDTVYRGTPAKPVREDAP